MSKDVYKRQDYGNEAVVRKPPLGIYKAVSGGTGKVKPTDGAGAVYPDTVSYTHLNGSGQRNPFFIFHADTPLRDFCC